MNMQRLGLRYYPALLSGAAIYFLAQKVGEGLRGHCLTRHATDVSFREGEGLGAEDLLWSVLFVKADSLHV